jgi:hypothetical protein
MVERDDVKLANVLTGTKFRETPRKLRSHWRGLFKINRQFAVDPGDSDVACIHNQIADL